MIHGKDTGFTSSILTISLTETRYGEAFASELCGKCTRWELESRQGWALLLRLWFPQENESPPRVPGIVRGKRNSQFPIPQGKVTRLAIPFPHERFPSPSCRWSTVFPRGWSCRILIYSASQSKSNLVSMPCRLGFSKRSCLPCVGRPRKRTVKSLYFQMWICLGVDLI